MLQVLKGYITTMVQVRVLVIIKIPPAPWCIARCTWYFDTQMHLRIGLHEFASVFAISMK